MLVLELLLDHCLRECSFFAEIVSPDDTGFSEWRFDGNDFSFRIAQELSLPVFFRIVAFKNAENGVLGPIQSVGCVFSPL